MLPTVGESVSVFAGTIRVTLPSAGETTTSGSDGGTRFGSRKKKAIKSATRNRNPETYQKPRKAVAAPSSTGLTIYGMLSLTILNANQPQQRGQATLPHLFYFWAPKAKNKSGRVPPLLAKIL